MMYKALPGVIETQLADFAYEAQPSGNEGGLNRATKGSRACAAAVAATLILSACGNPNTSKDFLCEAQEGSPCTTISAVDGTGAAGVQSLAERPEDTALKSLTQNPLFGGKKNTGGTGSANLLDGGHPYNAASYRSPEVVGTLWIAPILDEGGIFHEARFVHFLIQEGKWRQ